MMYSNVRRRSSSTWFIFTLWMFFVVLQLRNSFLLFSVVRLFSQWSSAARQWASRYFSAVLQNDKCQSIIMQYVRERMSAETKRRSPYRSSIRKTLFFFPLVLFICSFVSRVDSFAFINENRWFVWVLLGHVSRARRGFGERKTK